MTAKKTEAENATESVKVKPSVRRKLKRIAAETDTPIGELVERAVNKFYP